MSSSNDSDAPAPTTPPVVKTKTLMGDQSVGGTVYIRPRPEADAIFSELETIGSDDAPPKALATAFAASEPDADSLIDYKTSKDGLESIDEELKMAEALALAIQSNPNMSPEEIKQLIGVKASVKDMPDAAAGNSAAQGQQPSLQAMAEKQQQAILAAGQKFSSLFQAAVDNSSENAKKATNQGQETFKALSKSLSSFKPPVAIKWTSGSSTSSIKVDEPAAVVSRDASAAFSIASADYAAEISAALKPPSTSVGDGILAPGFDRNIGSNKPPKWDKVRLSGLAWKRRGGMGKYTASAWELRRFELRGTKLLYFNEKGEASGTVHGGRDGRDGDDTSIAASNSFEDSRDMEGVYAARRSSWLEQAAATWTAASSDPSSPRGDMDLAKEKAVVQISYGHSGAPSPFSLSIKVNGDTKWKLCFNQHKALMEWMAALSDVVVQCSVDHYNANLLAAADPSYQGETALLPPPAVNKPPALGSEKEVNRLWMCEKYSIGNANEDERRGYEEHDTISASADDESSVGELDGSSRPVRILEYGVQVDAVPDHSVARALAQDNSERVWSIPEHNLRWLAAVMNAALFLARSCSMPIEGFWYIFVVANMSFYLCLVKEPSWKSLLQHVKAVAPYEAVTPIVGRKSAKTTVVAGPVTVKLAPAKPIAGTTTVKLKEPRDPPVNAKNEIFAGWRAVPGESVLVRSHGYNSTKAKVPSPGELYELVNVDIFESPHRYPDMATRVALPKCVFDDGGKPKTWRTPDIFIVSIALPTDQPSPFAKTSSDGSGYTITMYYRMHQDTRDILRRVTADNCDPSQEKPDDPQKSKVNAARLMEEWVRRAPTDPKYQARFKVVTNAHNLEEIGMPSWIAKYNGKPFLVKKTGVTGFLYNHPELSCVEFDISLHAFPLICRTACAYMKDTYFKKVLVSFGFVIEGRTDDELPECLIGLMQLCYPDPAHAIQGADFFGGTARKSF